MARIGDERMMTHYVGDGCPGGHRGADYRYCASCITHHDGPCVDRALCGYAFAQDDRCNLPAGHVGDDHDHVSRPAERGQGPTDKLYCVDCGTMVDTLFHVGDIHVDGVTTAFRHTCPAKAKSSLDEAIEADQAKEAARYEPRPHGTDDGCQGGHFRGELRRQARFDAEQAARNAGKPETVTITLGCGGCGELVRTTVRVGESVTLTTTATCDDCHRRKDLVRQLREYADRPASVSGVVGRRRALYDLVGEALGECCDRRAAGAWWRGTDGRNHQEHCSKVAPSAG